LHRARTLDLQDLVRRHRAFGEAVTGPHAVTLVHAQVLAGRHLVHPRLGGLWNRAVGCGREHEDLALAALDLAELHHAIDLGHRRRVLGTTRLEQLRDARQAAGDVAGLVRLARDLGDGDTLA